MTKYLDIYNQNSNDQILKHLLLVIPNLVYPVPTHVGALEVRNLRLDV